MAELDVEKERARRAAEGMRLYMVFMEPREGAGDRSAIRGEHFAFVNALEHSGRLVAGGPLVDEASGKVLGRGVFILRGASLGEVEAIMREEPFHRNGFRDIVVHAWRLAEGELLSLLRDREPEA
ncbi:YciI family protein [Propylenella binzhouense]|uniref:YciI family protein n=1 Tax=Propylenella binzhouense TaxID=2555902 RepID=UPI001371DD22